MRQEVSTQGRIFAKYVFRQCAREQDEMTMILSDGKPAASISEALEMLSDRIHGMSSVKRNDCLLRVVEKCEKFRGVRVHLEAFSKKRMVFFVHWLMQGHPMYKGDHSSIGLLTSMLDIKRGRHSMIGPMSTGSISKHALGRMYERADEPLSYDEGAAIVGSLAKVSYILANCFDPDEPCQIALGSHRGFHVVGRLRFGIATVLGSIPGNDTNQVSYNCCDWRSALADDWVSPELRTFADILSEGTTINLPVVSVEDDYIHLAPDGKPEYINQPFRPE